MCKCSVWTYHKGLFMSKHKLIVYVFCDVDIIAQASVKCKDDHQLCTLRGRLFPKQKN